MKFRDVLEDYVIDEWIEHYIEFVSLKEQLEKIDLGPKNYEDHRPRSSSFHWNNAHAFQIKQSQNVANTNVNTLNNLEEGLASDASMLHDDAPIRYPLMFKPTEKSAWENKLKENIKKVDNFYHLKKQEIEHFYNYFMDSLKKVYQQDAFKTTRFFSDLHEKAAVSAEQISLRFGSKKVIAEIYTELLCLESFCIMNTLSANLLIKLYTKKFATDMTPKEIKELFKLEKYEFTKMDQFSKFKDVIIDYVVKNITHGNVPAAQEVLQKNNLIKTDELARISFFLGVVSSTLVVLLVAAWIEFKSLGGAIASIFFSSFQVYRFVFTALLVFWYIPIARYALQSKHLNFNFVLDIRPSNMGDIKTYITLQTYSTLVFMVAVLLDIFYCSDLSNAQAIDNNYAEIPNILALVLFLATFVVLLMPLKSFLLDMKYALGKLIIQCMGSPFTTVAFIHILTADCMTSFNKSILDAVNSFCWVYQGGWQDATSDQTCNFSKFWTIFILAFPYLLRFWQCLKRYYVSKLVFPNIFNAVKYGLSICTIVLGQFSFTDYPSLLTAFYFIGFTSWAYNNYWDNYNDWGLFRRFDKQKRFLRTRTTFSHRFYYTVMTLNFFLRLNSLGTLVPAQAVSNLFEDPNLFMLVIEVLEITRRFLWAIIRVEHEIFTNFENLRDFWTVPNVFYLKDKRKKKLQAL